MLLCPLPSKPAFSALQWAWCSGSATHSPSFPGGYDSGWSRCACWMNSENQTLWSAEWCIQKWIWIQFLSYIFRNSQPKMSLFLEFSVNVFFFFFFFRSFIIKKKRTHLVRMRFVITYSVPSWGPNNITFKVIHLQHAILHMIHPQHHMWQYQHAVTKHCM